MYYWQPSQDKVYWWRDNCSYDEVNFIINDAPINSSATKCLHKGSNNDDDDDDGDYDDGDDDDAVEKCDMLDDAIKFEFFFKLVLLCC